jgi:hypothetical protein
MIPKMSDAIFYLGGIAALFLLLGASVAIWKWAERYMTNMARVAAVLMIVGMWVGISLRMGLILLLLGLILMLVARSAFLRTRRGS